MDRKQFILHSTLASLSACFTSNWLFSQANQNGYQRNPTSKMIRTTIFYEETENHTVNQITERYFHKYFQQQTGPYIKILYQSAYQICNVYTKQNTALSAFKKLNGNLATKQVFLDHNDTLIPRKYHRFMQDKIKFNDRYNCHGFTFLDSQFWFELDNETADIIISDNNYRVCDYDELINNGICLFYNHQGQLIHSARKVNGEILSKFGINNLTTIGEEDILKRYKDIDNSQTLYLNPSE